MKNTFKEFSPSDCVLKRTRIDIWQYPLHTLFLGAESLLNSDELARAKRYHFARHQRRFTVARAMLRLILARYINLPPAKLTFSYNKHGKPELKDTPSLQFNLSHSGDLALLAVGSELPLGIDLEFFSARPYEGIGKHLFSPIENQALHNISTTLKPLSFFHIWAQKEALIKACGLGLAYPTQEFDVPIFMHANLDIDDLVHKKTWHMRSFMPEIACCAALCHDPEIESVRYLKTTSPPNNILV